MCSDRPAVEIRAIVPTGFGINCEAETAHALRLAGACPATIHLNDLAGDPAQLARARILVLAGGFSFGDHLGAGKVYANRILTRLGSTVAQFVADGGLVLGICNGFQVLLEAGLLPGAMLQNASRTFVCREVLLSVTGTGGPFLSGYRAGQLLRIPVAHHEGRYFADDATLRALEAEGRIAFRYAEGHNPNGSRQDVAGVMSEKRNVLGMMPHPERAAEPLLGSSDGRALFESAVAWARGARA